jgi:hypothetical protein
MQKVTPIKKVSLFYQDFIHREPSPVFSPEYQKEECEEYLDSGAVILYDKSGRVLEIEQGNRVSRRV